MAHGPADPVLHAVPGAGASTVAAEAEFDGLVPAGHPADLVVVCVAALLGVAAALAALGGRRVPARLVVRDRPRRGPPPIPLRRGHPPLSALCLLRV